MQADIAIQFLTFSKFVRTNAAKWPHNYSMHCKDHIRDIRRYKWLATSVHLNIIGT